MIISERYDLVTPWGTIEFNDQTDASYYWMTRVDGLAASALRTAATPLVARDGAIVHNAYSRERVATFAGQIAATGVSEAAYFSTRQTMLENLAAALSSIRRADGTLKWSPNGSPTFWEEVMVDAPVSYWTIDHDPFVSPFSARDEMGRNPGSHVSTVYPAAPLIARGFSATFDGAASYITAPDSASLDLGDVFAFEAVVTPTNLSAQRRLCDKGTNAYCVVMDNGGNIALQKSGASVICTSTSGLTAGVPNHVFVSKNGSAVKIVINGVDRTGTITNATLADTSTALFIGRQATSAAQFWLGSMDEIVLYNYAPTVARAQAHYAARNGTNFRRQMTVRAWEALQVGGTILKEFQFGLIAGDPKIVAQTLESFDSSLLAAGTGAGTWALGDGSGNPSWALGDGSGNPSWSLGVGASPGQVLVTNDGNADAYPTLRVVGSVSGVVRIRNLTTGDELYFDDLTIDAGHYAEIDTWAETAYLDGQTNQPLLGGLNSAVSTFPVIVPGENTFQLYADGFDASAKLTVLHRDTFQT